FLISLLLCLLLSFPTLRSSDLFNFRVPYTLAKFSDDTYEEKTHFIHLVDYGKKLWKDLIFFRDYLNANESARVKYSSLKKEFLNKHKGDIKAYTDYKESFVKEIFRKRK